ncbi:MAG: DUF697 domain-containing protein [Desulfobacterales bacterium]|nr:DUF697 domain-containing protein [Desulfobacterales bacterium]
MSEVNDAETDAKMNKTIRNHALASMGVCLIPFPAVDLVGLTGVQLNLVRNLAKGYRIKFNDSKVKHLVSSLVGTGSSIPFATIVASAAKFIPIVGHAMASVAMPISAGATTYAVGKVFLQHFASGGTFLTFNPDKVRAYYAEMLEKGKTELSEAPA